MMLVFKLLDDLSDLGIDELLSSARLSQSSKKGGADRGYP
ncbi:hypothetical protein X737_36765 [Mesorhizobium sp. L48C026A00]|nr:hypothetical protein X737_36765 [Mesorhizobium sp. L48C026A00]